MMELIRSIEEGEYGIEGEVFFGEFNKFITLFVEDDNITFAEKCAVYLNQISPEIISRLCEASIRYCNDFLECIGEPIRLFEKPQDVLKLIYPSVLIVPYPEHNDPVIHLELNCEWEQEHGMEWIIRNNSVLYVGAFNGEDPWSDFSENCEWNYA